MQRYELFCIIQNIKHIISKKVHIMSFCYINSVVRMAACVATRVTKIVMEMC